MKEVDIVEDHLYNDDNVSMSVYSAWRKLVEEKINNQIHIDAQTCQVIVEDLMLFMGSADMLIGCSSEQMVHIRNKLYFIVSGKLLSQVEKSEDLKCKHRFENAAGVGICIKCGVYDPN